MKSNHLGVFGSGKKKLDGPLSKLTEKKPLIDQLTLVQGNILKLPQISSSWIKQKQTHASLQASMSQAGLKEVEVEFTS